MSKVPIQHPVDVTSLKPYLISGYQNQKALSKPNSTFWAIMLWDAVITMAYTDTSGVFTSQRQQLHEAFTTIGSMVCMQRVANVRLINAAYYIWHEHKDMAIPSTRMAFVYDFLNVCCNLRTLKLNASWENDWISFQNGNSQVRVQEPAPSNSDPDLDILL